MFRRKPLYRVALARAVFGDPCLVVLDEPNSNLDTQGDTALNGAIHYMRSQGKTVVIISHRPTAMAAVNKVLVLNGGGQEKFGLKEQVFNIGKPAASAQARSQIQQAQQRAREAQQAQRLQNQSKNNGIRASVDASAARPPFTREAS